MEDKETVTNSQIHRPNPESILQSYSPKSTEESRHVSPLI